MHSHSPTHSLSNTQNNSEFVQLFSRLLPQRHIAIVYPCEREYLQVVVAPWSHYALPVCVMRTFEAVEQRAVQVTCSVGMWRGCSCMMRSVGSQQPLVPEFEWLRYISNPTSPHLKELCHIPIRIIHTHPNITVYSIWVTLNNQYTCENNNIPFCALVVPLIMRHEI